MRIIVLFLSMFFTLTLTQCTSIDFSRRVAQQGNLLPKATVDRVKIGMSKEEVAILMGTSLLSPTFNENRWDYAYTWRRGHGNIIMMTVSFYFTNGVLKQIERNPS